MANSDTINLELYGLISLIKKLRGPDGCPWDRKQKPQDIGKYILEEAYEVFDCLEAGDHFALREELGDLLFQILFLAEMEDEAQHFSLCDIIAQNKEKMIRRHPHVFGGTTLDTVDQVRANWQQIKNQERLLKNDQGSIFGNIPRFFPALKRAQKITALASTYGLDWSEIKDVIKKLEEEMAEFSQALQSPDLAKVEEEMGDLFFTLVNLSRFVRIDAESALTKATNKFLRRFDFVAEQIRLSGKNLKEASVEEINEVWEKSKKLGI